MTAAQTNQTPECALIFLEFWKLGTFSGRPGSIFDSLSKLNRTFIRRDRCQKTQLAARTGVEPVHRP